MPGQQRPSEWLWATPRRLADKPAASTGAAGGWLHAGRGLARKSPAAAGLSRTLCSGLPMPSNGKPTDSRLHTAQETSHEKAPPKRQREGDSHRYSTQSRHRPFSRGRSPAGTAPAHAAPRHSATSQSADEAPTPAAPAGPATPHAHPQIIAAPCNRGRWGSLGPSRNADQESMPLGLGQSIPTSLVPACDSTSRDQARRATGSWPDAIPWASG